MSKIKIKKLLILSTFVLHCSIVLAVEDDSANFHFSPIHLLLGSPNLGMDFKVHPEWTLGPELGYWNHKIKSNLGSRDTKVEAYGLHLRAVWYKNGAYTNGFYISPKLSYQFAKGTLDSGNSNSEDGFTASTIFGYGWFWNSFNITAAAGPLIPFGFKTLTVSDNTATTVTTTSVATFGFITELNLGWTF